jgi:hypothetical protein
VRYGYQGGKVKVKRGRHEGKRKHAVVLANCSDLSKKNRMTKGIITVKIKLAGNCELLRKKSVEIS